MVKRQIGVKTLLRVVLGDPLCTGRDTAHAQDL